MKKPETQRQILAALAGGAALLVAPSVFAVSPLEYPDNGSAQFSRGGAWLAVGNEPIAAHYNPATLATQGSGFSIEQQLNIDKVCYAPKGPNNTPNGPATGLEYLPMCNSRQGFPNTIPSISIAWRATDKLGVGFAIVPPNTQGIADEAFPTTQLGINHKVEGCVAAGTCPGVSVIQPIPAPNRYQILNQQSTIIYPTLSVGYELFRNLRVGVGFIAGIGIINVSTAAIAANSGLKGAENFQFDTVSNLQTHDLFMPGVVASVHWSILEQLDASVWARWIDAIDTTTGSLLVYTQYYNTTSNQPQPICTEPDIAVCPGRTRTPNSFGEGTFKKFRFPIPPEIRAGVRFHLPRSKAAPRLDAPTVRDPLKDDVFDVELDGSYTLNSSAQTVEVRFVTNPTTGQSVAPLVPNGYVPGNADRWNGYIDSYGVRLGGQVNVIPDKLGIRAGTWFETRQQDPAWLNITAIGAQRGGVGGGVVFRQDFIDFSFGYQYQWSSGLNNNGNGLLHATVGQTVPESSSKAETGTNASNATQWRETSFAVNGGRVTQSGHAFTIGGTVHF